MNRDVFGEVIGMCDNCRRIFYRGKSTMYYVRFQNDSYCFCNYCVTVVKPQKDGEGDG